MKRYNSSEDFEADVAKLEAILKQASEIVESAEWRHWMRHSSARSQSFSDNLGTELRLADTALDILYQSLIRDSE